MTVTSTATSIPASCIFDPTAEPLRRPVFFSGLLAKDELVVWIGREKDRKTTVVLNLAICAAIGRDFLGCRFVASTPLRVVIFDYESQDDSIHRRYHAICDAMKLSPEVRERLRQNLLIVELRRITQQGSVIPGIDTSHGKEFWRRAVAEHPADLYIIDPMRCLHSQSENDSIIINTLTDIRNVFQNTLIIPHHMVKRSQNRKDNTRLADDMRLWSDGARGSGAIKAHADVIVCQERTIERDGTEVVHFGAFMKDAAEVEPMPLQESTPESFLWVPCEKLPDELRRSYDVLCQSGATSWRNQAEAAKTIILSIGVVRSTANRHVKSLIDRGRLIVESDGMIGLKDAGRVAA